jgi:hypothetical protein
VIGHRQVIAARRAGYKPKAVFLEIGHPPALGLVDTPAEQQMAQGQIPTVWTNGASVSTADLRWLVGLRVHVVNAQSSSWHFWEWWEAVCDAHAAHVVAVEPDGEVIEWRV